MTGPEDVRIARGEGMDAATEPGPDPEPGTEPGPGMEPEAAVTPAPAPEPGAEPGTASEPGADPDPDPAPEPEASAEPGGIDQPDPEGEPEWTPHVLQVVPRPPRPPRLSAWALGLAVLALVGALFVSWMLPVGVAAIVVAIRALRRPAESRGPAIWALVLGIVSVLFSLGWLAWAAWRLGLIG